MYVPLGKWPDANWVSFPELLNSLPQRGVEVVVQQGNVALKAPAGALRPSEVEMLRKHREDLLRIFCRHDGEPVQRDTAGGLRPFCPHCEAPLWKQSEVATWQV